MKPIAGLFSGRMNRRNYILGVFISYPIVFILGFAVEVAFFLGDKPSPGNKFFAYYIGIPLILSICVYII